VSKLRACALRRSSCGATFLEPKCPFCHWTLSAVPTSKETSLCVVLRLYAISKQDQEQLCLLPGRAYGIPTVALRYFGVYGPRQPLTSVSLAARQGSCIPTAAARKTRREPRRRYLDQIHQRLQVKAAAAARSWYPLFHFLVRLVWLATHCHLLS
jgi:nucleoside-diphosphate-sugar epimerase